MPETLYNDQFFSYHEQGARDSAREVIPLVFEFIRPTSMVDVGCGGGTWLAEFRAAGVSDYLGVDGDYVNRQQLAIEPQRFQPRDLSQPLEVGRRFDLAMSLEVAEHLPAEKADTYVASLVRLADVILFSAAIPHQGGTGHINEQWPEYWQEKFARHDYLVIDCLRERLWRNAKVKTWYKQNLLFLVSRAALANHPPLAAAHQRLGESLRLSLVHPDHYLLMHETLQQHATQMHGVALRAALKLREISVLVFPNWRLPNEQLTQQLRAVLAAVTAHPAGGRTTLVFDVGRETQPLGSQTLSVLAQELLRPDGTPLPNSPSLALVGGQFGPDDWRALLTLMQLRLSLPDENSQTVQTVGAARLPIITLAAIQNRQPLAAGRM